METPAVSHTLIQHGCGVIVVLTCVGGVPFKYTVFTDGELLPLSSYDSWEELQKHIDARTK